MNPERYGTFNHRKLKNIKANVLAEQLSEELPQFLYEVVEYDHGQEFGIRTDLKIRCIAFQLDKVEIPDLRTHILTAWIDQLNIVLSNLKTTLKDLEGGEKMKAKAKNVPVKKASTAKKVAVKAPSKPSKMSASKMKKC
jgi:hypothetical protein